MFKNSLIGTSFLVSILLIAVSASAGFDHSHANWDRILKQYVTVKGHASTVNYKSLKASPSEFLNYLKSLESVSKSEFGTFSEAEKLAFLINAYNAFTVKLIIDKYPIKSIKDIGGLFSSPWKIKFFNLLEEQKHLDNIEHDIIRKDFKEPRIHFALVCASVGCPALKNEAYVHSKLNTQLEEAALNFLADRSRNRYLPQQKKLEISSLFKWYGGDFPSKYGTLEAFLAPRITDVPSDQAVIKEKKASITYLDYDWSLNE